MLAIGDNLKLATAALLAYRLRALLTMLGLMMGVTTIITVITLINGANLYVEQKIANLGINVFQVSRLPIAVTDFLLILKAMHNKNLTLDDLHYVAAHCPHCAAVGARASYTGATRYSNNQVADTVINGQTANMSSIDPLTVAQGRYFTEAEDQRASPVCLIGAKLVDELFSGLDPLGKTIRVGNLELLVIGTYERIGSILGRDQDNFASIPMGTFLKARGSRTSLTIEAQSTGPGAAFESAQDEVRLALRARRRLGPAQEEDFYFGTASSYISLWQSISGALFAVFIMVSGISSVVGGIVIMNVMLVSVTERTKEIGIRRAVGATQSDIMRQFLSESVLQCLIGGLAGILAGFLAAIAVRQLTNFPVSVQTSVALLGFAVSTGIGLFFGIYPATRAARLDPVEALRSE